MTTSYFKERSRDPVMLTWYRFVRVLKKITRQMDGVMHEMNLSRAQFDLLMQIAFEPGIMQDGCAARMTVTKGNVTQHVNRLEGQGLIRREKEGRVNHLHLTDAGKALVEEIMPLHDVRIKEIMAVLNEEERLQFQSILRKFDRSLD